jgi:hypothetical protein
LANRQIDNSKDKSLSENRGSCIICGSSTSHKTFVFVDYCCEKCECKLDFENPKKFLGHLTKRLLVKIVRREARRKLRHSHKRLESLAE